MTARDARAAGGGGRGGAARTASAADTISSLADLVGLPVDLEVGDDGVGGGMAGVMSGDCGGAFGGGGVAGVGPGDGAAAMDLDLDDFNWQSWQQSVAGFEMETGLGTAGRGAWGAAGGL